MRTSFATILIVGAVASTASPAGAASLPSDQTFKDAQGKMSLLTRRGGKGFLTAATRCGRLADVKVAIRRGKVSGRRGRTRISGSVLSRSKVSVKIRRGSCAFRAVLKRDAGPV